MQNLVATKGVNHGVGLAVTEWCQTRTNVLEHLDEDASESAKYHMSETGFILGTDEQFGSPEHLLHHDTRSTFDLHHAFELELEMFGSANIQGDTAHIALVDGTNDLGNNGIAHALGKCHEFVLLGRDEFRNHRNASTRENVANGLRRHVTIAVYAMNDFVELREVDAIELHLWRCRLWRVHNLGEGCGQRHLVGKVDVSLLQELGNLRSCGMQTGQHRKYGFLALQYLLVQGLVSLVEGGESRRSVDDCNSVDVVELLFAVVNGNSQLSGSTCGQYVDGVSNGRTWEQLSLQFIDQRSLKLWNTESSLREGIGEHNAWSTCMGDYGKVASFQWRQGEDTSYCGEFLTTETTHDACLTEEGFDCRITGGDGTRMTGCCPTAALTGTSLDGCNATTLSDKIAGVEQ